MTTVLVIDDESAVRALLRQVLQRLGLAVVDAQDGREGLEAFRTTKVDLVICDLIMPRMDGIETINGLRRLSKDIPIIAMSGGGRKHAIEILKVACDMGADRVLSKPFTIDQLSSLVTQCLASSKAS